MRILFLTSAHNSMSQRAAVNLHRRGHEISVELALSDEAMCEAVERFRPQLILAPFLKKAIPEAIWSRHKCFIVHPGIKGDRGPSSLDWAIQDACERWGVTVLEAIAEMDAGDIWASETFETKARPITKSSLYRGDVADAAMAAILEAVDKFAQGTIAPEPLDESNADVVGRLRPPMKQDDRRIDWSVDTTATIARRIRAADSNPGLLDVLFGAEYFLYGAHEDDHLHGPAGELLGQRHGAVCRATVDGAIWISHLKERRKGSSTIKLPATMVLGDRAAQLPVLEAPATGRSFREIRYEEESDVGYLHFDFYNGAMSTNQCERLREAYVAARARQTKVLVLLGGRDFWSNGIHLNTIEASENPADESWRNIVAIDDLILEILRTPSHLVVAGVRGNAGAGGAMLALAADRIWSRASVVFNPHYKSMGLFGSEYWTYTLPRRVGAERASALTEACLPLGAHAAREIGFVDEVLEGDVDVFTAAVRDRARRLAFHPELSAILRAKRERREADEKRKPLARYRDDELSRMHEDFYGSGSTYHDARRRFVHKLPASQTCSRIAVHRRDEPGPIVFDEVETSSDRDPPA